MKIKNILMAAMFAGVGATFTSCEDFTDLSPIDSFTDKSYWKTADDLKMYATGFYGLLSSPSATLDGTSNNFVSRSASGWLFDESTVPTYASQSSWTWEWIRDCNYFFSRYQTVQASEKDVNKYVGEMRFFRSLLYFSKIKTFGDVPWYDRDLQTNDTEELYKGRDPRDMVLGKVIEDLKFAIEWLPEKNSAEKGRLHKDAARQQLARVCLYYGTYMKYHNETPTTDWTADKLLKEAADQTDAIINSGNYDIVKASDADADTKASEGYPLAYANLFVMKDHSNCKESVLSRFYQEGVLSHETGRQEGGNGYGLTKDFIESFLMKDGTPIYNAGSGYKGDNNQENEIADRDPRLYQLIPNKHKPELVLANGDVQFPVLPDVNAGAGVTGYPCTKFHSANSKQAEARNTYYDWFIYRYAEVLLINAEAKAELGLCTQEVLDKTINKLRDRVDMAHLTTTPVADSKPIDYGYSLSNLIYEIRRERRIELVHEGFRLDDLKRWNGMKVLDNPKTMFGIKVTDEVARMYKEIGNIEFGNANEEGKRPVVEYEGAKYLYHYAGSRDLDATRSGRHWKKNDRRWLDPLPKEELLLNKNLKQNPGWTE